jgi:hypothetical protein
MRASDFRDGDIVQVRPDRPGSLHAFTPFEGVVDSRSVPRDKRTGEGFLNWVWVRRFGRDQFSGGWYPEQCRLLERPTHHPALPIPDNITLGEN